MATVVTNGSLIPNEVSAPLDARTYCRNAEEMSKVENAYVGMHIWLQEEGKEVIVTSLKTYVFQHVTVVAVDQFVEVPTHRALSVLMLTKPEGYSHIQVRKSCLDQTFQQSEIILDTLNNEEHRSKLFCLHGDDIANSQWVACPEAGFTAGYDNEQIKLDLDFVNDLPVNIYYAWYDDKRQLNDWQMTPFPATGAVHVSETPGTSEMPGTSETPGILSLAKPENGLHLIIRRAGEDGTRANSTVVIDTLNDENSRNKVTAYLDAGTDGSWVTCPADGFGSPYDNAAVAVDLSELQDLPATLFYAWIGEGGELADWKSIIFPCSGAGSNISLPQDDSGSQETTQTAGNCILCLCTVAPQSLFDGLIWISGGRDTPEYIAATGGITVLTEIPENISSLSNGTVLIGE